MSIQAVAWALEQDMPARPKLVLVSIANHADHRTGYCWLKAETIADEASCSPRGVFNFVGDLIRNGYIRKSPRKGDDGKQRANDYWIVFDRAAQEWNAARADVEEPEETEETSAAEVVDDAAPDATSSEPHAPRACGESEPENARRAYGPHASTCSRIDIAEPSKTKPNEKDARANPFAGPPRRYRPPPPEPQGADMREPRLPIFVFKGTRAWDAWVAHKSRERRVTWNLSTRAVIDGKSREGWWFPTLFPPSQQPQASKEPLMTEDDESFVREGC
ncbi:MAG: helix-turn-helix domain-containing protein [Rhizobiales bacterium]|nr:helix-turn-helix domain-containing protein [Hyphomicrobiales bacterium]